MTGISIGVASRQSGVKVPTIRYYEGIGLLPKPARSGNGRRVYEPSAVNRLSFIRHARTMDFSMDDIRTLITLQAFPNKSCREADAIARARLADVEERIARLTMLRDELQRMVRSCAQHRVANCRVIEGLAEMA